MDKGAATASVEAALAEFNRVINEPLMDPCKRCDGRGYHHGFGENGHDPDWCQECGGNQYNVRPGEELRAMSAALAVLDPIIDAADDLADMAHDALCCLRDHGFEEGEDARISDLAIALQNFEQAVKAAARGTAPNPSDEELSGSGVIK